MNQSVSSPQTVAELADKEQPSKAEVYLVAVILSLLSLVGTAGNALVLYVFSKKKDTLVSTQCIIALATVDFITCLVVIPFTVYMEYTNFHIRDDFCCKLYQFLITSSIPFSALIMVAIALDRYLCICHPFVRVLTVGRSKVMICVLWLVAGALGVCVALMFSVYERVEVRERNDTLSGHEVWSRFRSDVFVSNPPPLGYAGEQNISDYDDLGVGAFFFVPTDEPEDGWFVNNTGECKQNDLLVNKDFQYYYQILYNTIFPLCLVIVVILYIMIYHSVIARRNKRQQQKSKSLGLVQNLITPAKRASSPTTHAASRHNDTILINPTDDEVAAADLASSAQPHKSANHIAVVEKAAESDNQRRACKADSNRLANLKTAAMLFVVNVVFVITFMPAYILALELVPYNMTVFYLYFANNVANPVIYSFMNKNFRADLIKIFNIRRL